VSFARFLVGLRPSLRALLGGRVRDTDPRLALVLLGIATIAIYAVSIPAQVHQLRYFLPLASATMPLIAIGVARIDRRTVWFLGVLAGLSLFYGVQAVDFGRRLASERGRNSAGSVERLRDFLTRDAIRFAYAGWGDAMITTYLTDERTIVTDYQERTYPLAEVAFRDPAIILRDAQGTSAEGTLRSLDTKYERARVAGYRVYWPIHYDGVARAALGREGWKISATTDAEDADLMLDGDLLTRWSAAADESSHPSLRLDLGRDQTISGVYLDLGGQPNAAFRHLLVETSRDGESWELAKDASWDFPISFRPDGQVSVMPDDVQMVLFAPRPARWLRLTLLEAFPGQIWTVAELDVFGQASAGSSIFQPPVFADPTSFEVAEHRLRREIDRHPETNAALLELRELYRTHGQPDRAAAIDRIQTERFSPTVALGWRFGAALELLGYDRKSSGPRELEITYYWKARSRMDADYAASVHVRGSQGHFQSDYVLGPADHPTRSWQPQEIVKQTERLTLPEELPSGVYDVHVGVWNPSDHHHLLLGPWWHHAKTAPLLEGVRAPQPAEPVSSRRS
jgi:F5/8 type C domain